MFRIDFYSIVKGKLYCELCTQGSTFEATAVWLNHVLHTHRINLYRFDDNSLMAPPWLLKYVKLYLVPFC